MVKNDQNGQKWSKSPKMVKMVLSHPKWSKMVKMVKNGANDEAKRPEGPPARSWGPEGP